MFEVGFTEIVLILGLALLVLGPEKLPGLAQKVGRWTGRARSMARQLRNQLEQEVTLEEMAKSRPKTPPVQPVQPAPAAPSTPAPDTSASHTTDPYADAYAHPTHEAAVDTGPHAHDGTSQVDLGVAEMDRPEMSANNSGHADIGAPAELEPVGSDPIKPH